MQKNNSPYSANITGCAFMFNEFMRILPLLMSGSESALKNEIEENNLLQVNSRKARQTFMREYKRRYDAVSPKFWDQYVTWNETEQKIGLLYAILKAYRLLFDFHFDVTVKRWNAVERTVTYNDLMMEFNDLSARDAFVDSWTDETKRRCASQYLTILRQSGLMEGKTNELMQIRPSQSTCAYFLGHGEDWFLEACLLYPYEINDIKSSLQ